MPIRKLVLLLTIHLCKGTIHMQHHQQVINDAIGVDGPNIQVKALDHSSTKHDENGFAFAATFCPMDVPDKECPQTLLVQLGDNNIQNPFDIQWAKRYIDEDGSKLIVHDMKQLSKSDPNFPGYLLCGRIEDPINHHKNGGFMMLVDNFGNFNKIEIYLRLIELRSVVEDEEGYFAVGTTEMYGIGGAGVAGAAMLSTDKGLQPICQKHIHGRFNNGDDTNEFNEVIRYNDEFAMIGSTKKANEEGCSEGNLSDVLYVRATKDCTVICKRQIGDGYIEKGADVVSESGRSLTKHGNFVLVTGTRKVIDTSRCHTSSHDILFFSLSDSCDYYDGFHIDVDGFDDSGSSIVYNESTDRVYIGGETEKTMNNFPLENDLFIMEFQGRHFKKFERFGGFRHENSDVHLTFSDAGVVMMGHTESYMSNRQDAYLIERYPHVEMTCGDIELQPAIKSLVLEDKDAFEAMWWHPESYPYEVTSQNIGLDQALLCEKF